MAARRAITEELRAQGVRVTLVKPAEISAKAQVYLSQHPELYREALERAQRMAKEDELRKARRRKLRAPMVTPDPLAMEK
jgi:NAD(P)-dependent dehydrogenase (short-subunit alcohol dehydrogenase family)